MVVFIVGLFYVCSLYMIIRVHELSSYCIKMLDAFQAGVPNAPALFERL